jgi:hypothetical protein
MRRAGNLFETILDRDNLRLAAARVLRGKRGRADARAFVADLEWNLARLAAGLWSGDYPVGRARQCLICDPKEPARPLVAVYGTQHLGREGRQDRPVSRCHPCARPVEALATKATKATEGGGATAFGRFGRFRRGRRPGVPAFPGRP